MQGIRFSAPENSNESPFDTLLKLFKEVIVHTSGDVDEALDWLKQLDEHYKITDDKYTFNDFVQELKDKGFIKDKGDGSGGIGLTSKAEGAVRKAAMDQLFGTLKKGENGDHQSNSPIGKGDVTGDFRNFQFGDALNNIVMNESLKNALVSGGIDEFRMTQNDLVVEEAYQNTSLATVLMIDISHSMILYGEDRITPAKMVAMALSEWITTRYPKDTLDIIVYGNESWPIQIKDLPYLQVGPYHTNFVAGLELAMGLLKRRKTSNKQIFNITDGKPSCLIEPDGSFYKNSFGLDPYITGKCLEMAAKTKKANIPVNTFMIAKDAYLQHFIRSFSEINGGNAYYTGLNKLGQLIFSDYQQQKKRNSR